VKGSTYVKGAHNKKIESLFEEACGVLDKMINGSTSVQQVGRKLNWLSFWGPLYFVNTFSLYSMSVAINFTY